MTMMRKLGLAIAIISLPLPLGGQLSTADSIYRPNYLRDPHYNGPRTPEVVAYFISATWCVANRQPGFKETVRKSFAAFAKSAASQRVPFAIVGVSLDWEPEKGYAYLTDFAAFDEIIAGRNWFNSVAVNRMWRDPTGTTQVPQLVLVEHTVRLDKATGRMVFGPDRVVRRLVSQEKMRAWADSGAPFRMMAKAGKR